MSPLLIISRNECVLIDHGKGGDDGPALFSGMILYPDVAVVVNSDKKR